jgi:hypothetical protein
MNKETRDKIEDILQAVKWENKLIEDALDDIEKLITKTQKE